MKPETGIEFPVIYDAVNGYVRNGDGYPLADGYEENHALGQFITDAINRFPELTAEVEELRARAVEADRLLTWTARGHCACLRDSERKVIKMCLSHLAQDYLAQEGGDAN